MRLYICFLIILLLCISCKKKEGSNTGNSPNQQIIVGNFTIDGDDENICQTVDGNFIIVAVELKTNGYIYSLFVAKLNPSLDILWTKTFGTGLSMCGGITATSDGGVVITSTNNTGGSSNPQYYLDIKKLNSSGDSVWDNKTHIDLGLGAHYMIRECSDKGFVIGILGRNPSDPSHYYPGILKINQQGDSLWFKCVPAFWNCYPQDVNICPDQGFIISSEGGLSKEDSAGNVVWNKDLGIPLSRNLVLNDGSIITVGTTYDTSYHAKLLKVDENGNMIWEHELMSCYAPNLFNLCRSVDNGFTIIDQINYNLYEIKTDANGILLSKKSIYGNLSWGIIPLQNKYIHYIYEWNKSTQQADLLISYFN